MKTFENDTVDEKCPKCGKKTPVSLKQVANEEMIKCKNCSKSFQVDDPKLIAKIKKLVNDMDSSLNGLSDLLG